MSFWSKIRDLFSKQKDKVVQQMNHTVDPGPANPSDYSVTVAPQATGNIPEPKIKLPPHDDPVVAFPPVNPNLQTQPIANPKNIKEALQGSVFDPTDVVAVYPSGVNGPKQPRIWPKPHPDLGENAWGYATRVSFLTNPATQKPFMTQVDVNNYLLGSTPRTLPFVLAGQFAHVADIMTHPEDWFTQREVDDQQRSRDAWGNWHPEKGTIVPGNQGR